MKQFCFLALASMISCSIDPGSKGSAERYFLTEVKPVLQQHCLRCHNGTLPPPALNLTSKATAFIQSAAGRDYIRAGEPDRSLLVSAVQRLGTHSKLMPPSDISLTDDQIGMLREWIEDGAFWPDGKRGTLQPQHSLENP